MTRSTQGLGRPPEQPIHARPPTARPTVEGGLSIRRTAPIPPAQTPEPRTPAWTVTDDSVRSGRGPRRRKNRRDQPPVTPTERQEPLPASPTPPTPSPQRSQRLTPAQPPGPPPAPPPAAAATLPGPRGPAWLVTLLDFHERQVAHLDVDDKLRMTTAHGLVATLITLAAVLPLSATLIIMTHMMMSGVPARTASLLVTLGILAGVGVLARIRRTRR